jgi:MFS transporter, ACS family, hexuronate transporter
VVPHLPGCKGIELKSGLIAVWIPFIAADLGSFFAGGISGYLIMRGWSLGAACKALIVFGGTGMTMLPVKRKLDGIIFNW